jgi:hypothetical protein
VADEDVEAWGAERIDHVRFAELVAGADRVVTF